MEEKPKTLKASRPKLVKPVEKKGFLEGLFSSNPTTDDEEEDTELVYVCLDDEDNEDNTVNINIGDKTYEMTQDKMGVFLKTQIAQALMHNLISAEQAQMLNSKIK